MHERQTGEKFRYYLVGKQMFTLVTLMRPAICHVVANPTRFIIIIIFRSSGSLYLPLSWVAVAVAAAAAASMQWLEKGNGQYLKNCSLCPMNAAAPAFSVDSSTCDLLDWSREPFCSSSSSLLFVFHHLAHGGIHDDGNRLYSSFNERSLVGCSIENLQEWSFQRTQCFAATCRHHDYI